ncbi:MAG: hypothetical protein JO359_15710 [Candidatus Eremiobacteraeota bacterium]|nr:hypothetical protein [Candidatus Eremiobacteraeota bacterium]
MILYKVTLLTLTAHFLFLSGGDALRVASGCKCASLPAGTVAIVALDEYGRVAELRRATGTENASERLPPSAIVVDPRSSRAVAEQQAAVRTVTITLVVAIPPDTPPGDDLYVSTDRSGWGASELRMERVDPLHWSVQLRLPSGQPLLYRYSRGSFATLEADRSGQLAPARKLTAKEGLVVHDTILRYADLS